MAESPSYLPGAILNSYLYNIQHAINIATIRRGEDTKFLDMKGNWEILAGLVTSISIQGGKIIFIGNGGSAAIASHMALDFSNAGKIRAICFNDGPLLTCLANDYSYEKVFEKAIEMYADKGDLVIAISSSGQSPNVLNAVTAANKKECKTITLSGFDDANLLYVLGDINIHVPIPRPFYGLVECSHYLILHFLLDYITKYPV